MDIKLLLLQRVCSRRQIQEINWQRKSSQTNAGEQLKLLEQSWVGLVSKNYEIERACINLEAGIAEREAERAREAAMAVDHTPIEEILERQHPKYVPEPSPPSSSDQDIVPEETEREPDGQSINDSSKDPENEEEEQADSPPQPPPQEMNNDSSQMDVDEENEGDDDAVGPQPVE